MRHKKNRTVKGRFRAGQKVKPYVFIILHTHRYRPYIRVSPIIVQARNRRRAYELMRKYTDAHEWHIQEFEMSWKGKGFSTPKLKRMIDYMDEVDGHLWYSSWDIIDRQVMNSLNKKDRGWLKRRLLRKKGPV